MSEHNLKVGDRLAFKIGAGTGWRIYPIERIGKTGIIKCGPYTLRSDLRVRGKPGPVGPWRGQVVTEKIMAESERISNARRIADTRMNDLTDDQLARIVAILDEPKQAKQ